ncbi:MAG: CDP-diacylglycerol--glycerol-3-phosphate 3-phosphatidyltransferase [Ruminococcaceae bacterium]|nr:CDP-diacylglycerol--glycerol-3-phosphate 3-phosphatidyltransferase [Oscillospiraceae bacterium]
MKKSSMNIPNTLSLIRVFLVPIFVAALLFMRNIEIWGFVVPAIVYIITGLTDMLDGKIARKYNLVTDFGKFIDPLADKFMVLSSMIAILVWMILLGNVTLAMVFVWVVLIILLRELGVTSLRLVVAGKSGIVVAASMLGKIKTVSQMVGTVVIIVEPIIPFFSDNHILSYAFMAIMAFTTLFSGIDYLKAYMPHIDSNK